MKKIILLVVFFISPVMGEGWSEFSAILMPSNIEGIGVFATHDIKAGSPIFCYKIWFEKQVKTTNIPEEFLKYCIEINSEYCFCPSRLDCMEIDYYMNHSKDANVTIDNEQLIYIAAKDIKAGEEFLMDYNTLEEPEFSIDPYYKDENKEIK